MLSIIISTYKPDLLKQVTQNIAETIVLTEYEIIPVHNPGLMGICEAYNTGAQEAKYDNLLFVHEDVLFRTENWGEKLIQHLSSPEVGVVGVAGSDYVPTAPSGWYVNSMQHQFLHLIQNTKEGDQAKYDNFVTENKHRVYALDGVFLAMRKEVFSKIKFNEDLKGFHGYDLDISLHSAKNYENYVIGDILIEHFSLGAPNKDWLDANVLIRKKYGAQYQNKMNAEIEVERFQGFLYSYFQFYGISLKTTAETLRFIPIGRIRSSQLRTLMKKYYHFFKYRSYFKEKFKTKD